MVFSGTITEQYNILMTHRSLCAIDCYKVEQ